MNSVFLLMSVLAIGSIGLAFVAFNKYSKEKDYKKHMYYNIVVGLLSIISFIIALYFINTYTENKKEHFNKGGLMRCSGQLDNYLISNKDYILRDGYFIKKERVLSLDHCTEIE